VAILSYNPGICLQELGKIMNKKTQNDGKYLARVCMGTVDLGGLVVSVLAIGPKVRGFDPDRGRWIFKGDKNPEHHFLRRGSKAVGPMS
jgi:hypothetical protein